MPKYKVTRIYSYPASAVITAPNLESAERMVEDIDGAEFVQYDDALSDSWVHSITQQEDDDD
jgi:hypothetical protein